MSLFNLKKLSWKIAGIVVAAVVVVGGTLAFYYQIRLLDLIDRQGTLNLQYQTVKAAQSCDSIFGEAMHKVEDLRNLVESSFSVASYRNSQRDYFDNSIRPSLGRYLSNMIDDSAFIFAAYFAVNPDLAGVPLVSEVFFEKTDNGVVEGEAQSYEDYMDKDSEDMAWFYGAFDSGRPYWTHVHEFDGVVMVSYVEPVVIGGTKVGVVGVDIAIDSIIDVVNDIRMYETGFAILEDNYDTFIESNAFVRGLSDFDKARLTELGRTGSGEAFQTALAGIRYMGARTALVNGYHVFTLAPLQEFNAEKMTSITRFAIIFPTALLLVVIASVFVGRAFSKPLVVLSAFMNKASHTGDITITREDAAIIGKYSQQRDEIGQSIASSAGFVKRITEISEVLATIATGDLTTEVVSLSANDVMGNSLMEMNGKLRRMFGDISGAANQVSVGAKQVSDGAQTLALGSSEQAASIQELSASTSEIAETTKANAGLAEQAAQLADTIKQRAEVGSGHMDEMIAAVNAISEASGTIGKVIKVIDDIAFQTNILALNAAVEAARAGQHGKGFAVVAEEVRNLAAKSAEAASDTGRLIEDSMAKADLGVRIADDTAGSLAEIVSGIDESNQLVEAIAKSSESQLHGIQQINTGIDQVAHVVQHNSATAQESAAAAEEMSAQSAMLDGLIAQFKI